MTFDEVTSILDDFGLPYAFDHFPGPVEHDNFVAYVEDEKNIFLADDTVYVSEPHFQIELYTAKKDIALEQRLIDIFSAHETPWSGGVSQYLDDEKVYMTVFYV